MTITIRFLGAVETVTGSRFLIENESHKILVDAGLFQGLKELRLKNWAPLPLDVTSLESVVISHAHLDHCGYLPKLIEQGYHGKIHATKYSKNLAAIVLRDSASLQVEDAKYAQRKGYSKHAKPKPLYTLENAERAISSLVGHNFHEKIKIAEETYVTFYRSGHILGAASILVEFYGKRFFFSGDLGRPNHPILVAPDKIPVENFDALIVESTYGNREHPDKSDALADAINRTVKRKGSILIPAFAIDRTEILLLTLKDLLKENKIPPIPIYVDSPMALAALREYRDAFKNQSSEIHRYLLDPKEDPFELTNLREITTVEDSKKLNNPTDSCIIISASGMATGGRVVHHLEWMLPDSKNTILLVGYQAIGTRGQKLLSGAKTIKMYGALVPVGAEVAYVEEFSVHGDSSELIDWLSSGSIPKQTFVVHGEKDSAHAFAKKISEELRWNVITPSNDQPFTI